MSSSSTSVDAGDDVTISVATGESGNFVGLKAVDKSVLLLKKGNDIDMNQVSNNRIIRYKTNFLYVYRFNRIFLVKKHE